MSDPEQTTDELTPPIWRNRDFLRLWSGQTVSMFGTQITTFAIPVLAITTLDADAGDLSLLRMAEFLPFLFLTLPIGIWVDRHAPRPAMIVANLVRSAVIASIAVAGLAGWLQLSWLGGALLVIGACTVLFDVAYLSYLPSLVGRNHLVDGNSKLAVSASVADVSGPGVAGLLIQVVSVPFALLADAISYCFSLAMLTSIRTPDTAPGSEPDAVVGIRAQLAEGLSVVWRNRYLRTICLESFLFNFFIQFSETLVVLYALRERGVGTGALGLAIGLGGLGGLLAAVVAPRVMRRFGFGPTFFAGTALGCAAPVIVPLAQGSPLVVGALIAFSSIITGFGVTISVIGSVTLRQSAAPAHLLGRVNAVMRLASYTAIPLGALATGLAATGLGTRSALFLGCAGLALPVLVLMFSPILQLRDPFDN